MRERRDQRKKVLKSKEEKCRYELCDESSVERPSSTSSNCGMEEDDSIAWATAKALLSMSQRWWVVSSDDGIAGGDEEAVTTEALTVVAETTRLCEKTVKDVGHLGNSSKRPIKDSGFSTGLLEYGKDMEVIGDSQVMDAKFEIEDTLLGEGNDISMAELRPCLVREFSWDNLTWLSEYLWQPTSIVSDSGITNEEGMREYADLKYCLLLYDGLLVLAGSSIASFSVGENVAFVFLGSGIGGFLYLLLVQRSIDGLPAPTAPSASINRRGKFAQIFGRFKGLVSSLVLAFVFATIAVKYGSGDSGGMVLTPKEVVFGMLGFLACKVAVVLAAFKTMPMDLEENE
ncbi:hypothetical protein HYC85_030940 [Camellia sinensis]|uniref:Transmembrane protein n=1 Tax=Camellia sinensis TaxID=4442 RepID=A0A7J7FQ34_CAMSI|nr:hypothetical protein HYC85_030940 [Camellia sinensis]